MDVAAPVPVVVAFVAGVLSFLSPCVLPLIPGYVAFLSGRSLEDLAGSAAPTGAVVRSTAARAIAFVLGFTCVFTLLGASASVLGAKLASAMPVLTKFAGALIILFGLHTTGLVPLPWLQYERRMHITRRPPGFVGAAIMGVAFAFGWTPCIGPILASILALAATQETVHRGMGLLLIYSLGLAVPFLLTAMGVGAFLKFFARYKPFLRAGEIVAGGLLIVLGGLVFTNRLTALIRFMPASFMRFAK